MRHRWEVVHRATNPAWDQKLGHDVWRRTERGAKRHAAWMNRLGDGTAVITYETRRGPDWHPSHAKAWRKIISNALFTGCFAVLATWTAVQRRWGLLGVDVLFAVIYGGVLCAAIKELRDGSRGTSGDCDDSGTVPGTATGQAANSTGQGTGSALVAAGGLAAPYGMTFLPGTRIPLSPGSPGVRLANNAMLTGISISYGPGISFNPVPPPGDVPDLVERVDDTPILAYKTAMLTWCMGDLFGPCLQSSFTQRPYDTSDRAECHASGYRIAFNEPHAAPHLGCSCGFYAVREREILTNGHTSQGSVLLEVELFGRVIVFEHGYRAERQRILRIGVAGCWYCNAPPSCVAAEAPTPWQQAQVSPLVPLCAAHLPFARANLVYSLDELGERFGADVGHEPALDVAQQRQVGS